MKKRFLLIFTVISVFFSLLLNSPLMVSADDDLGQVRVIIENNAFGTADGANWEGILIDDSVDITSSMTMMDAVTSALKKNNYSQNNSSSNYVTEINGLSAGDGGNGSAWLGSLNNWFINEGFDKFTVEDGDEVHIMYTVSLGNNEGSLCNNTDTRLSSIKFSNESAKISPAFSSDVYEYTLDLPAGTESVSILPEAINKNYQVRIYKSDLLDMSERGFKFKEEISVKAGEEITVVCGDPSWPSLSTASTVSIYKIKISFDGSANFVPESLKEEENVDGLVNTPYTVNLQEKFNDRDEEDTLTYFVSIDGGDFVKTVSQYSFTPSEEKIYILSFKANDGKADSTLYTVILSADSGNTRKIVVEDSENGKVASSVSSAKKNEKITLSVNPDSGYALKSLSVKTDDGKFIKTALDEQNKNSYIFVMPASNVTITSVFDTKCTVSLYGGYYKNVSEALKVYDKEGNEFPVTTTTSIAKPFTFVVTPGNYNYILFKPDGSIVKNGEISVSAKEQKKDVFLKKVKFQFNTGYNSSKLYKEGGFITVKDSKKNVVELNKNLAEKALGGGYKNIWYFLEIGENGSTYTYNVRMVDERLDITQYQNEEDNRLEFKYTRSEAMGIKTQDIKPGLVEAKTTFKISKNANAHIYIHEGRAYVKLREFEWSEVDTKSNEEYDIYHISCPTSRNFIVVAGGANTEYRKTSIFFSASSQDAERTFQLEKKDSSPLLESFVASDDLYTNIGDGGYLCMNKGDEKQLEGFRVTQTVTDSISNVFMEPDMHYEILSGNSVELIPGGGVGREYVTMKAVSDGISVIKVTYDDINIIEESVLFGPANAKSYYCAPINEKNTGIVIVNVGGSKGEIDSGIKLTNYDTVYFPGKITASKDVVKSVENSAVYKFTPTAGGKEIKVYSHDPITNKNDSWETGWVSCPISSDDSSCTVNLKEGRNIIRIESETDVLYTTINAKEVNVKVTNETNPDKALKIEDSVGISFEGLELPIYKMCGIYNPGFPDTTWVEYTIKDQDKTVRSPGVQYPIDQYNTVTFTVNRSGECTLSGGQIHCGHMGSPLDSHLNISLGGSAPNLNASSGENDPYFCILPEITLYVAGPEADVIDLINEIDKEDYLGSIKEIMAAKAAYDELTGAQKKLVTNYDDLDKAYKAVEPVIAVINAIDKLPGNVTLENKNIVDSVNTKFDALAADQKLAVYNSDKLKKLNASIQDQEEKKARIDHVINLIEYLPEVDRLTLNKNVLNAVTDAQAAYDKLPADERANVTNIDKLLQIQKRLPNLRAAQPVMDSISAIGRVTELNYLDKAAAIISARNAYEALTEEQKTLVTNLADLKQSEYDFALFEVDEDVREVMEVIRELSVTFDGQGNKIAGPLTQTEDTGAATWDIWASWKDYVANARGLINLIASDKLSEIENLGDLEQAEAYISTLEVNDAANLLSSLPNASTVGESGAESGTQLSVGDLKAIATAIDAYNNLTDEQRKGLSQDSINNLLSLDLKASTYADYLNEYLQIYVNELANYYIQYKDTLLSRNEMTAIQAVVNKYDSYTAESQTALNSMNASSTGLTFEEMRNVLVGQLTQVEEDINVTFDLDGWIQSLPTNVTMDNLESIENEIAAIEKQYYSLNKNAKSYIRNMRRLNALKAVAASLRDEVNTFIMNNPVVSATATKYNSVTVTWDDCENAENYYVYRKSGKSGWKRIATTATLSYIDNTVSSETTYLYTVRAVNSKWGKAVISNYDHDGAKATTPFGGVIKLTSAKSAGYNSVKLTWTKLDGAMGYRIYQATSKNGTYKAVKTVRSGNTLTYTNKKLTVGKTYYYKVRAYDKVGNKVVWASYSEIKSAKPIPATTKISKITSSSKSASLKWRKVSGASGYVVYRATSKNGSYQKVKAVKGGKTITYTDSKLKSKKTYYYKVRAYRAVNGKHVYGKYSAAKLIKIG